MYQLHVTLLPLVLTSFFPLSVEVTGATVPTRERIKEALETVGKFLRNDIGSNWLESVSKDRMKPITIAELMEKIINSTRSDAVRKAAGIMALVLEQERTSEKTNESLIVQPQLLKDFIETIADRDDIICLYRKISHVTIRRSEEWEEIMKDVTADYSIYLALDTGYQYVLCVKRLENNSTSTTIKPITKMTGTTEEIIVNTTSEFTPETSEIGAEGLLKRSLTTLNRNGTRKVSGAVDRNNSVDNEDEEIRERDSSEDCGSESSSCTSSLISSTSSASRSPKSASESVESMSADEEESVKGKESNRVTPCRHRTLTSTRHSRDDHIRNYINGRYSMQEISNFKTLPISSESRKSNNYQFYICQSNKICLQIKSPEGQKGLMDIPLSLQVNNESPEGLLNLQPQFSHNGNGFVKNLHDNGISTHQPYPTHMNTHFIVLKRNNNDRFSNPFATGYHPNFISTQHSVEPSSKFVTRQLVRGGYSGISRKPQNIHSHQSPSKSNTNTGQIDALEHEGNHNSEVKNDGLLSLKIFVNNPSKKTVKLSIYTDLDPQIEVYHNKDDYLDKRLTQSHLKMFQQPGRSLGEEKVDKSIIEVGEIEKQNYVYDFDELMNLLTSDD